MKQRGFIPTFACTFASTLGSIASSVPSVASVASVAACSLLVFGCASKHSPAPSQSSNESQLLGEDGTDTNELENQTSSLTASLTLAPVGANAAPTADQIVQGAENTSAYFLPERCLTIEKNIPAREVTYTFNGCAGPWGLRRVSGKIIAKFSADTLDGSPALKIEVSSTELKIRGTKADYHASAWVMVAQGTRRMVWEGQLTGETPRGREFSRNARWDIAWSIGEACIGPIQGHSEGKIGNRDVIVEVMNLKRCRGECPQNGGMIRITANRKQVEITFDGSNTATFQGLDGKEYDVPLACGLAQ